MESLEVVWSALDVNGDRLAEDSEGFCAIADVLGVDQQASPGPDNLLDGVPELLVIKGGFLYVYNGQTGVVQRQIPVPDSLRGGAPNVDDFDGDGFPEVGTAFSTQYAMIDLQQDSPSCPRLARPLAGRPASTCWQPGESARDGLCVQFRLRRWRGLQHQHRPVCVPAQWLDA